MPRAEGLGWVGGRVYLGEGCGCSVVLLHLLGYAKFFLPSWESFLGLPCLPSHVEGGGGRCRFLVIVTWNRCTMTERASAGDVPRVHLVMGISNFAPERPRGLAQGAPWWGRGAWAAGR